MYLIRKVNKGAYGVVYQGCRKNQDFAIKRGVVEKQLDFNIGIKELDLLTQCRHPFVIDVIDAMDKNPFLSKVDTNEKHYKDDQLYIILEWGGEDLDNYIHRRNVRLSTSDSESELIDYYAFVKMVALELLLCVEFIHSKDVIHRDLKPSNLLIKTDDPVQLCVCDFGLSKVMDQGIQSPRTTTRWYRSPESELTPTNYGKPIDMWSVGLILAELVYGKALFEEIPESQNEILKRIQQLLPEQFSSSLFERFGEISVLKLILNGAIPPVKGKSLAECLTQPPSVVKLFNKTYGTYEHFIDIIINLLVLIPENRLSATEALASPFFSQSPVYKNLIDEIRFYNPPISNPFSQPTIARQENHVWCREISLKFLKKIDNISWLNPRSLFQAIDMFNRIYEKKDVKTSKTILFIVCIYLSYKYFLSEGPFVNISTVIQDLGYSQSMCTLEYLSELEWYLIKRIFNFNLYRRTIYEIELEKYGIINKTYKYKTLSYDQLKYLIDTS